MTGLFDQLRRADVGEEERGRRVLPGDGIAGGKVWIEDGGALAAHAQHEAVAFGGARQVAVDRGHIRMAAGQRGHNDGVAQAVAEKRDRGVDSLQINFRQRLVNKLNIIPARTLRYRDILSQRHAHMLNLALPDFVRHKHSFLLFILCYSA
jgi:hypothetical protein